MTATLLTTDGEYHQVSDWARTMGEFEGIITGKYCVGSDEKAPWIRDRLFGSVIVRIVRDDYADQLPEHEYTGDQTVLIPYNFADISFMLLTDEE